MRMRPPRFPAIASIARISLPLLLAVAGVGACVGCTGDPPDFEALWARTTSRVHTPTTVTVGADGREVVHQRPHLVDGDGRYVHVYGINVSGSHKAPLTEEFPSEGGYPSLYPLTTDPALRERCLTEFPRAPECVPEKTVSYVDRPFPLDEADRWFGQLADLGFNSARLLTNWESVQPYRPGACDGDPRYTAECYDLAYLEYYEALIAAARRHGIYVLVDMHQDVFSRHLFAYYNEKPETIAEGIAPGSLEATVLALFPPYTDWVRGHGAGRWVVETCLPEKDMDSPHWGMFRALGSFKDSRNVLKPDVIGALTRLFQQLAGGGPGGIPAWVTWALSHIPDHFEVNESSDFLPWTFWPTNGILSLDADRCYAAFFAGKDVFPAFEVEGENVEDYLQGQYIGAYLQLVERAKGYDNVIGYDLMNEPIGVFAMLTAAAAYVQTGLTDSVRPVLEGLLGADLGGDAYALVTGLSLLPADREPETLAKWGLEGVDVLAALSLNLNFDEQHLQPFYERLGQRVQEVDEDAVIWFEPGGTLRTLMGASGQWDMPLTRPQGIRQLVFAPHWYPDIYPTLGINSQPREFNPDEYLYRDFREALGELAERGPTWLGNVPVVLGEFGTYFNYGGIEASMASGYAISAHILNSYYEAFEALNLGRMVWCFAPDNSADYGEWWNHEDFSVIGPDGEPRAWPAYVRTHARATSGKLVGESFTSPYHFWDPEKGERRPDARYELTMESRETLAATEVYVPRRQYPDGFYAWLSDGVAYFDDARQILYWYPTDDRPGEEHTLAIEPPYPDRESLGWSYFFSGGDVLVGEGGVR